MTATYSLQDNALTEQPAMERPVKPEKHLYPIGFMDYDYALDSYYLYCQKYNEHIATLRTIPCHESARSLWKDGQKVEEGRDYYVTNRVTPPKLMAFPLPVKSEDDTVHNEILVNTFNLYVEQSRRGYSYLKPGHPLTLNDWHKVYDNAIVDFIAELQQKYIITKR